MRAGEHPIASRFVLQALLSVVDKGSSSPAMNSIPLVRWYRLTAFSLCHLRNNLSFVGHAFHFDQKRYNCQSSVFRIIERPGLEGTHKDH